MIWCIHIWTVVIGYKSRWMVSVVRLSTSICADRQLWRVRAEWLFSVSRTQSAAGVIRILSSDINKRGRLHKVRHTDTLRWQCVKEWPSVSGCVADINEGRKYGAVYRCVWTGWWLCFFPLRAAATLKVLLGVKRAMIQDPADCHAILFPRWLCSLPHLFPDGATASIDPAGYSPVEPSMHV